MAILKQQSEEKNQMLGEYKESLKDDEVFYDAKFAEMREKEEQRYKFLKQQFLLSQQRSNTAENTSVTQLIDSDAEPPGPPIQSCTLF